MRIMIFFFLIQTIGICTAQTIDSIVNLIATENRVEDKYIGFDESDVYSYFEILKNKASKKELLDLVNHDSVAVEVYSIYALIDRELIKSRNIFEKYLKEDKAISVLSGCFMEEKSLSSMIYFRYIGTRYEYPADYGKDDDYSNYVFKDSKELERMDSLILFSDNPEELLYKRAFYNRIYTSKYKEKIEEWAFERKEILAIRYVFENLYEGNRVKIKDTILDLLQKKEITAFEKNEANEMLELLNDKN